ncbi:Uncharacterised protein [Anaerococcus prevotii]|nr:Uncharacterised protein [Anaerococcus prevotii]
MERLIGKVYFIQSEVEDINFERVLHVKYKVEDICEFIGEFAEELQKELEGIVIDE